MHSLAAYMVNRFNTTTAAVRRALGQKFNQARPQELRGQPVQKRQRLSKEVVEEGEDAVVQEDAQGMTRELSTCDLSY